MIPGPDQIIACPHCAGLARYRTLVSGNTFDATVWTDGKMEAPMLPQPPGIVRCGHCGKCYLLEAAEEVGELGRWADGPKEPPAEWAESDYVIEASEAECLAALAGGIALNPEQEREFLILTWRRGNDAYRQLPATESVTLSAEARGNLEVLLGLLGRSTEDRVFRGEILRQLGRFDEARQTLAKIKDPNYHAAAQRMLALCDAGDSTLRVLDLDEEPEEAAEAEPPDYWNREDDDRPSWSLFGCPVATMIGVALIAALLAIVWLARPADPVPRFLERLP
jgi:hypothetical protein